MLFAVSMRQAEDLFTECEAHDRQINYEDTYALAAAIRSNAAEACCIVDREKIHIDEVTLLKDAIERAEVDSEGDTVIAEKRF